VKNRELSNLGVDTEFTILDNVCLHW
jgi:hypothetical protein